MKIKTRNIKRTGDINTVIFILNKQNKIKTINKASVFKILISVITDLIESITIVLKAENPCKY